MRRVVEFVSAHRGPVFRCLLVIALTVLSVGWVLHSLRGDPETKDSGPTYRVKVEHVRSGDRVKLSSGEILIYAGIRSPLSHDGLADEARTRNMELVEGKRARLRFDKQERDRKDRLVAYIFVGGAFVNETLVREGLAYVRLTPETRRFAETLIAAQNDARTHRRGLWKARPQPSSTKLPADPKYGNFHRPNCEETPKINPQRLVTFRNKREAFGKGFAPCEKCKP